MRKKRVWRYYCEYCGKGGCSAGAMSKHEKHCTMNPNRECRMCEIMGEAQPDMSKLLAMLPTGESFKKEDGFGSYSYPGLDGAVNEIMPTLLEITNNCPMCIFSILRQRGLLPMYQGFNLNEELKKFWAEINDREDQETVNDALYG